ncbi:MAG: hypothetical protein ACETWQ_02250 [Phycisphaerae bacterium]
MILSFAVKFQSISQRLVIWNLSVLLSVSALILITEGTTGSNKKCPAPIAVVAGLPTTGTPSASLSDNWCGAANSRRNDDWLVPTPLREAGLVG